MQTIRTLINGFVSAVQTTTVMSKSTVPTLTQNVAHAIKAALEFDKDAPLEPQIKLFLETMGWKKSVDVKINMAEGILKVRLGSNMHILKDEYSPESIEEYVRILFAGIGLEIFDSEVSVDASVSPFSQSLLDVTATRIQRVVPEEEEEDNEPEASESSTFSTPAQQATASPAVDLTPMMLVEDARVNFSELFKGVFIKREDAFVSILWDVLREVASLLFENQIPPELGTAMSKSSEEHATSILAYLLNNVKDLPQNQNEIGLLIGEYFGKGLKINYDEATLEGLLRPDVKLVDSSVLYRDFTARSLCAYTAGQKCTSGPRTQCDFVMHFWAGLLSELTGKSFSYVNRIPAGRRQNLCLVEYSIK